jgi:exodeoxyribonuclease V alpha subunit
MRSSDPARKVARATPRSSLSLPGPAGALAEHPAFSAREPAASLARAFSALEGRELSPGDLTAAWELVRATALPVDVAVPAFWLLAAVLEARRQGHTRLELPGEVPATLGLSATESGRWRAFVEEEIAPPEPRTPALRALVGDPGRDGVFASPVVRVTSRQGVCTVALARDAGQERRLARWALVRRAAKAFSPNEVRTAVAAAISSGRPLHSEQESAVVQALARRLALVAGGPGTGKTTIILTLVEAALRLGVPADRIALAAPTGKAARRIEEAVTAPAAKTLAGLGRAGEVPAAATLHSLLGLGPSLAARPLFHEGAPLPHQLVIVDEASMIGLDLLHTLMRAVAADATLVLLGDPDQLPAVEAGDAFRGLVQVDALGAVRLTHSHRMRADDPGGAEILTLAQAVKRGDWPRITVVDPHESWPARGPSLIAVPTDDGRALAGFFSAWHGRHMSWQEDAAGSWPLPRALPAEAREKVAGLLQAASRARLLAVTRGAARPSGAAAINDWFHREASRRADLERLTESPARFLPGEPVMVTENDPARELANGDTGVVLRMGARGGGTLAVAFPRGSDLAFFPLMGLESSLALAYAVTVHKAQGSEHDHVALVLPADDVPILGRELLYTALTRARQSVTVVGDPTRAAAAAARAALRGGTLAHWLGDAAP